jgi:hypothetical protein
MSKVDQQPTFVLDYDVNGNPQIDPSDPTRYKTKLLTDDRKLGTLLPAIGIVITY